MGGSLFPATGIRFGPCCSPWGIALGKESCVWNSAALPRSPLKVQPCPQVVLCSDGSPRCGRKVRNLSWAVALGTAFQKICCRFSFCCLDRDKVYLKGTQGCCFPSAEVFGDSWERSKDWGWGNRKDGCGLGLAWKDEINLHVSKTASWFTPEATWGRFSLQVQSFHFTSASIWGAVCEVQKFQVIETQERNACVCYSLTERQSLDSGPSSSGCWPGTHLSPWTRVCSSVKWRGGADSSLQCFSISRSVGLWLLPFPHQQPAPIRSMFTWKFWCWHKILASLC